MKSGPASEESCEEVKKAESMSDAWTELDHNLLLTLPRMPRDFYERRALEVAPDLLGLILVHETQEGLAAGIIIETEAYEGPHDKACHAYLGRKTRRNEVMFGPPGHAYVYFTYGMHYMLNVVTAPPQVPHAVLIRSIKPVLGLDLMSRRRGGRLPLAIGPGRLCQAMGITTALNGEDLVTGKLYIVRPPEQLAQPFEIARTTRIGIDYAGEARDYLWRFVLTTPSPHKFTQR